MILALKKNPFRRRVDLIWNHARPIKVLELAAQPIRGAEEVSRWPRNAAPLDFEFAILQMLGSVQRHRDRQEGTLPRVRNWNRSAPSPGSHFVSRRRQHGIDCPLLPRTTVATSTTMSGHHPWVTPGRTWRMWDGAYVGLRTPRPTCNCGINWTPAFTICLFGASPRARIRARVRSDPARPGGPVKMIPPTTQISISPGWHSRTVAKQ